METPQPLRESTSSTRSRATTIAPPTPATVVSSAAVDSSAKKGYAFRGWRYATAQASLGALDSPLVPVCLDTGCAMSLIDRGFLLEHCPDVKIYTMGTPMEVRGIGSDSHSANQYARIDLFLPG